MVERETTSRPPLRQHLELQFATPIVAYPWPDSDALNDDLRTLILAVEKNKPGMTKSNVAGWHSDADFFSWDAECVKALFERVRILALELTSTICRVDAGKATATLQGNAWANVVRSGNYHVVHNHTGSNWSGVYYVCTGEPHPDTQVSGVLEFVDPRLGANLVPMPGEPFGRRLRIRPKPGLMLVFPSWLQHFVHPYVGTQERIAVSFNVSVLNFRVRDDKSA